MSRPAARSADACRPADPPAPPAAVRWGNRLLSVVEDAIYGAVAALLAVAAVIVLVRSGIELYHQARSDRPDAMIGALDSLLLVFIFVELLYAVRVTLKERQIVAEPFLIAAILVAVKEIIVLSVKAANDYIGKGPEFARAMVETGLLGLMVALLSGSALLLRRKAQELPETASGPGADLGHGQPADGQPADG